MNITVGFSPCPNDTFMFAALINHWIDTDGFTFTVHMEDVEQLNEHAGLSRLDVTKMSFNRARSLDDYKIFSSGAALGNGCGPLLIAKKQLEASEILKGPIAVPGKWTTANLLFDMFYPGCAKKEFHLFSDIERLILDEAVLAGVIIHENRFTYQSKGLMKIRDLGQAWEELTGLPIPLGGIFGHKRLSPDVRSKLDELLRKSIQFARQHPGKVMPFVKEYAQEMDEGVMMDHINLYVNDFSLDLGEKGLLSIEALKKIPL